MSGGPCGGRTSPPARGALRAPRVMEGASIGIAGERLYEDTYQLHFFDADVDCILRLMG